MADTGYPGQHQLLEEHLWAHQPLQDNIKQSRKSNFTTWALTKEPVACKSLSGPTAELPQQGGKSPA